MSLLGRVLDERFFEYRRRSTSIAGIIGGVLAIVLFEYRYFHNHVWNWDLFAVGVTFVCVKLAVITWYYLTH